MSPETRELLERYPWPGNVRELENELRRMVALADPDGWIERHHLSDTIRMGYSEGGQEPATLQEKLDRLERSEILEALDRLRGNKTRAARELGLSRQGLKNKLARYGIGRPAGEREANLRGTEETEEIHSRGSLPDETRERSAEGLL
jgi:two-component system response regulator HupR/HoxA